MMFLKSTVILALVASVCATPVPHESSSDIVQRLVQVDEPVHLNHIEARAKIKDTTCPDNKKEYKKGTIADAVKAENDKTDPDKYNNNEKIFKVDKSVQLYKARLDNTVRAVFSRNKDGKYTYRGLIEHDKGTGDGFHKC